MEKQLLEEERKLKELEAINRQEEERRKNAKKSDLDAMYKRCTQLLHLAMAYMQNKSKHVEELDSKLTSESITFKPQTNKLKPEMEDRVKKLRQGYKLEKEHSKSPGKEKCKQNAIEAAKESKQRVQEFLQRNELARERREERVHKLKTELEEQQEKEQAKLQYKSGKHSEKIVEDHPDLKGLGMYERQELFLARRKEKLDQKRREKEAAEDFFQKATFVPDSKANLRPTGSKASGGKVTEEYSSRSSNKPPLPTPYPGPTPPTPPRRPAAPSSHTHSPSPGSAALSSPLPPPTAQQHTESPSSTHPNKHRPLHSASTTVPPTAHKHSQLRDLSVSETDGRPDKGHGTTAFGWADLEPEADENMEPGQWAAE